MPESFEDVTAGLADIDTTPEVEPIERTPLSIEDQQHLANFWGTRAIFIGALNGLREAEFTQDEALVVIRENPEMAAGILPQLHGMSRAFYEIADHLSFVADELLV